MNRLTYIVSTLVLFSIISCKKDGNSKSNKLRLSKMISWRTATPSKGIYTTEFIYDDQKRVTEIAFFNGDSVGNEIKSAKYRSIQFFYNGTDKNPYKTLGGMSNMSMATTETYNSYDNAGKLVRDSIAATPPYNTSTLIKRYSYFTNKIIVRNENNYTFSQISIDSFLVNNNNLAEAYTYITPYTSQVNGYKLKYDDKINPLNLLNIAAVATVTGPLGFPSYLAPGYCKNNITEYTHGYSTAPGQFSGQSVYYYTYSYNEDNLPEECRIANNVSNTAIKYYYID